MSDAETIPAPAGEGQAAAASTDAAAGFGPEILAGLSEELRSSITAGEPPAAEDTPEEATEDNVEGDELEGDTETADGAADDEEEAPPDEVAQWVDQIWENPRTISRIPQKRLGDVLLSLLERRDGLATRAIQNTHETAFKQGYQRAQLEQQVSAIDRMQQEGDYDGAHEALKDFPGGERNYFLLKAELQPVQDQTPQYYAKLGTEEAARAIAEAPGIESALRANFEANRYPANLDGYRLLLMDIGMLKARGAAKPVDPAGQALKQRREAAETRRAAPKPDVSGGAGAPAKLSRAALEKMTPEQYAAAFADPDKSKEIFAALSST